MPVGFSSRDEFVFQFIHLVYHFFTHRFAEGVAFASRKVCQQAREEHDLFLIDCNPVCVFEIFFHFGNIVVDFLFALFAGDEGGDIVHRARPV